MTALRSPLPRRDQKSGTARLAFRRARRQSVSKSGKKVEADYVFIAGGNKPNVSLVEKADPGAIAAGLIAVDEYLRVSRGIQVVGRSDSR